MTRCGFELLLRSQWWWTLRRCGSTAKKGIAQLHNRTTAQYNHTTGDRWGAPVRIWRHLFSQLCSKEDYNIVLRAIVKRLDLIYPGLGGWAVLEKDAEVHPSRGGIMIQVYDDDGRQPCHFDNGVVWMEDQEGKKWCSTAIVIHLSDSLGTYLAGPPLPHVFQRAADMVRDKQYEEAVHLINTCLAQKDAKFVTPSLRRAGHMLSFHPGEQVHAGVGSGGYRCSLTKLPRVTLYCTGVPKRFLPLMSNLSLAGAEGNTFGLVDDVDVNRVTKKMGEVGLCGCAVVRLCSCGCAVGKDYCLCRL